MQIIIMTSDYTTDMLKGFFYLWNKYSDTQLDTDIVVCGYKQPDIDMGVCFYSKPRFYSIGDIDNYPVNKWSDSFIKVLDNVADEVFMFMMDDFWPVRPMDTRALNMMYHYMLQFRYVLKLDVTSERLYSNTPAAPEECAGVVPVNEFYWGHNTYDTLGHLDLIKSAWQSAYHMSLWGGFFNRDLLKKIVIPGEPAQEIEIAGTRRLQEVEDKVLILGTRQAPLRHANVRQAGKWNEDHSVGLPGLKEQDRKELKVLGYI